MLMLPVNYRKHKSKGFFHKVFRWKNCFWLLHVINAWHMCKDTAAQDCIGCAAPELPALFEHSGEDYDEA